DLLDFDGAFFGAACLGAGFGWGCAGAELGGGALDVFAYAVAADVGVFGGGFAVDAAGLGGADDSGAEDQVGDFVAHAGHHLLEEAVAFLFVEDAGVALGEGLEADAAAEHVHGVEVVLPALVEDLDEDELFEVGEFLAEELSGGVGEDLARGFVGHHLAVAFDRDFGGEVFFGEAGAEAGVGGAGQPGLVAAGLAGDLLDFAIDAAVDHGLFLHADQLVADSADGQAADVFEREVFAELHLCPCADVVGGVGVVGGGVFAAE